MAILPTDAHGITRKILKIKATCISAYKTRRNNPNLFISIGLSNASCVIARVLGMNITTLAYDFIADRPINCKTLQEALKAFRYIGLQAPSMKSRYAMNGIDSTKMIVLPCLSKEYCNLGIENNSYGRESVIRLAYFGRLAENKGLLPFLSVFKKVSETDKKLTLDIWGSGPLDNRLQSEIDNLKMNRFVHIRGAYPEGMDGMSLMSSYDGLCLPSTGLEGIPLVLIEAMSIGLPALCSNVGAIRDVCIENPDFMLVEPSPADWERGLFQYTRRIRDNWYSRHRLKAYYRCRFSRTASEVAWNQFLNQVEVSLRNG